MFKQNKRSVLGFTLLETLVVISIVGIVAALGISFLSTILKGGNKTTIVSEIKQNGNYVMEVMSRYIRNANSINTCAQNTLSLMQQDSSVVTFSLLPTDNNTLNNRIASNSASLTNADIKNGVEVTSLTFSCDTTTYPATVNISFTLANARQASTGQEYKANQTFSTTVSLRTY